MPTLSSVIGAWIGLLDGGELLYHAGASLMRGGSADLVGRHRPARFGVLMAWSKPIRTVFNPIVEIFYPMPNRR